MRCFHVLCLTLDRLATCETTPFKNIILCLVEIYEVMIEYFGTVGKVIYLQ